MFRSTGSQSPAVDLGPWIGTASEWGPGGSQPTSWRQSSLAHLKESSTSQINWFTNPLFLFPVLLLKTSVSDGRGFCIKATTRATFVAQAWLKGECLTLLHRLFDVVCYIFVDFQGTCTHGKSAGH